MRRACPATARIGSIETIGFDGAMTITSACGDRRQRPRSSPVPTRSPRNRTSRTVGSWWRWTKYSWNSSQPVVGPDLGPHGLVGHRQDPRLDAHRRAELERDFGRAPSGARRSVRQRCVARSWSPSRNHSSSPSASSRSITVHVSPRDAPAADLVVEAGQRVGDGVVIGPDREPVELEVVAGVDDRPSGRAERRRQSLGHLRPADAAGEEDDLHLTSRSATSCIRSMVSSSYGAGMRTITVSKPRSRWRRSTSATAAGVSAR